MPSSPLYLQIAQELATEIASGSYPIGSQLPTEAALCEQHDISRFTAREALRCLVDRGMIRRKARIGSRVISLFPQPDYQSVAANPDDFVALAAGTQVVDGEDSIVVADNALAQRLGCDSGAEFYLHLGMRLRR
jgi:GntR family transcriptional regulator